MSKLFWLIGCIFFLLSFEITNAEEEVNVLLDLKDITNNEAIGDIVVTININGSAFNQYIRKNEVLGINLNNGVYKAEFKADNSFTNGKDYYGKDTLIVENNLTKTIFL